MQVNVHSNSMVVEPFRAPETMKHIRRNSHRHKHEETSYHRLPVRACLGLIEHLYGCDGQSKFVMTLFRDVQVQH